MTVLNVVALDIDSEEEEATVGSNAEVGVGMVIAAEAGLGTVTVVPRIVSMSTKRKWIDLMAGE